MTDKERAEYIRNLKIKCYVEGQERMRNMAEITMFLLLHNQEFSGDKKEAVEQILNEAAQKISELPIDESVPLN